MSVRILIGDCRERLKELPDGSVHCCVTSPPYFGLRDYGHEGQMGREGSAADFVSGMVEVFREIRRVLRDDGTLWLNLGDSYGKDKNRLLIPARTALGIQADGWTLRDEIIWHKPRTTPAPVKDRTVCAHEMIYLFSKGRSYYFDYLAIEEPSLYPGLERKAGAAFKAFAEGNPEAARKRPNADRVMVVRDTKRKRSVWSVTPEPYDREDAEHFATYPPDLIEPCILAGCPKGGTVIDPFFGAGTTGLVADRHGRNCIGIEINPKFAALAERRLGSDAGLFAEVKAA